MAMTSMIMIDLWNQNNPASYFQQRKLGMNWIEDQKKDYEFRIPNYLNGEGQPENL